MGDKINPTTSGNLVYVPALEFCRIKNANLSTIKKLSIFADICRLNTLYMIAKAGSGHIGSSFSSMEIFVWLLFEELQTSNFIKFEGDLFFSSKGHDAPAFYSVLMAAGYLSIDYIHKLRQINGLPGHPDISIPGIITNTGSLGMGISKAKGLIFANRLQNKFHRVFVLTGDGELQEGQIWESLISAVNYELKELTIIVDHNKLQSDTFVKQVSDLGDLVSKFKAFGCRVESCDGNNLSDLANTLNLIKNDARPKIVIAHTIKGKGVSFMEHTALDSDTQMYQFHSGAPNEQSYQLAIQEILERLKLYTSTEGISSIELISVESKKNLPSMTRAQKLISSYANALLQSANKHCNLVVLDADLLMDTGLKLFKDHHPKRFIECGIAEQDMVSVAGGLARKGFLPIVHSFSAFLSSRPNEQIYNNATENTKIIYVGSLAGIVPGGPGHSHQAIRDISVLSAMPGLNMMEPSCEREVELLLKWCIEKAPSSCYIRLFSIPWEISFSLPDNYEPVYGQGHVLLEGYDILIIAYGPMLLEEALKTANNLKAKNISAKVINLPWLNHVNSLWLKKVIGNCSFIFCIDNHYIKGGQGSLIASEIASWDDFQITVKIIGVNNSIPPYGNHEQVLHACQLDHISITNTIYGSMVKEKTYEKINYYHL
jgi:transketolase